MDTHYWVGRTTVVKRVTVDWCRPKPERAPHRDSQEELTHTAPVSKSSISGREWTDGTAGFAPAQEAAYRAFARWSVRQWEQIRARLRGEAQGVAWEMGHRLR